MTDLASLQNHQIRLAARPVGMTTRENWQFTTEPVTASRSKAACWSRRCACRWTRPCAAG